MSPVDNHVLVPMGAPTQAPNTISLSTLIEYIIQRTYHELTVLSELLPRKTDMERKIEIVQFASRTRQLFVRLLSLVKWANSAGKVDKCAAISQFLDSQAMLFVDTADRLARMSRETLVQARLPSFSLPCAIDVLTTGSFPRMPACIKERIVPPDPITPLEKSETLGRLNQIIEHRLVTSDLPIHMRRLKIETGRVRFLVEHEFAVTLTLMGDGEDIPWRLLDIEVLVEDPETGDGKALVHPLQVNYIHRLVQSRLLDNEQQPLHDLYSCLHSFCQSLQLEVLHSQTQRLVHERLGDHVRIEDYQAGHKLVLSYWRDAMRREGAQSSSQTIYKLSIHVDSGDPSRPLQVSHFPQIHGSDSIRVAQAIKSDHLSVEKLLIHTIQVRSTAKLKELEREFRLIVPGACEMRDLPSILYVPVIHPCMSNEMLCVTVDIQKGSLLVSLGQKETDHTNDIEDSLNGDRRDLRRLLSKLRCHLALRRCTRSIQHLQASPCSHLPITNMSGHPLERLTNHRLYIKLAKQPYFYVVVEIKETSSKTIAHRYYLLSVKPTTYDTLEGTTSDTPDMEDLPKAYLHAEHLIQMDTFACTHGACAPVQELEAEDPDPRTRKRKLLQGIDIEPKKKKQKASAYFVPELTHILALCEDRIPFIALGEELLKRGIGHQGIQVDGNGEGFSLSLVDALPCVGLKDKASRAVRDDLLSCKFRIQRRGPRLLIVENIFTNCPVRSTNPKEQGSVHRVFFNYDFSSTDSMEKVVASLLDDWCELAHLYAAVLDFADVFNATGGFHGNVEVKTFSYKRLTLAYGPNRCYTVSIQYQTKGSQFQLRFGTYGQAALANPHIVMATQLQQTLNHTHTIAQLTQILLDTWQALVCIGKLNTSPMTGLTSRQSTTVPNFSLLPQSPTHMRLVFRSTYCLDVHFRAHKVVAVRDGAYSLFDTSKPVEGLNPTPGLKTFLTMFVDESVTASHCRRRSVCEDDNPPSPEVRDSTDFLSGGSQGTGSPSGGTRRGGEGAGLRFQSPMTPPSNPTTPASQPQPGVQPSPSGGMMGTPSPGPLMAGSPSTNLHVPSPSSFVPAPSPSSLGIHMPSPAASFISPQGMVDGGSPYPSSSNLAMPSPGQRTWPMSPSSMPGPSPVSRAAQSPGHPALHSPQPMQPGSVMSPPSRILPQKPWAASMPTLLSHDALGTLLTPAPPPGVSTSSAHPPILCCPLERFLCSAMLRRHILKVVTTDESLQVVTTNEPGVIQFKIESLQFRVSLNASHLQSLQLKCSPTPQFSTQWDPEELQILEQFFETKVVCAPYKVNAMTAFGRILGAPLRILKDCLQVMKLELMGQAVTERNLKWSVQWCLTIPHTGPPIAPAGTPAVVIKNKLLFMLQLSRVGVPVPPGGEPQTVVVPILYDKTSNVTSQAETTRVASSPPPTQASMAINNIFKRFTEFNSKPNECSIYPAVLELLSNLVIPI